MKILIITDSRGAELDSYLAEHLNGFTTIHYALIPGADYGVISNYIQNYQEKCDYVAVIAGICSFTEKTDTNILYTTVKSERQNKIDNALQEVQSIKQFLAPTKVNIATIPPASLTKYHKVKTGSDTFPEYLGHQEYALIVDIYNFNEQITQLNEQQGIKTLNLADYSFVNSLKRRRIDKQIYKRTTRFTHKHLYDGVHFDDTLKGKIKFRILSVLQLEIDTIEAARRPEDDENSSSSEEESVPEQQAACRPDTQNPKPNLIISVDNSDISSDEEFEEPQKLNLKIEIDNLNTSSPKKAARRPQDTTLSQSPEPKPSTSGEPSNTDLDIPEIDLNISQETITSTSSEDWEDFKRKIRSVVLK